MSTRAMPLEADRLQVLRWLRTLRGWHRLTVFVLAGEYEQYVGSVVYQAGKTFIGYSFGDARRLFVRREDLVEELLLLVVQRARAA